MQIDIRVNDYKVNEIVFGDAKTSLDAYVLILNGAYSRIESDNGTSVYVADEEDAKNLIKALQKAIEIGVWK